MSEISLQTSNGRYRFICLFKTPFAEQVNSEEFNTVHALPAGDEAQHLVNQKHVTAMRALKIVRLAALLLSMLESSSLSLSSFSNILEFDTDGRGGTK